MKWGQSRMALSLSRYGLFLEETPVAGDPQGCGKVEQCRSNCRDATVEPTPHMDVQVPRKAGAVSGHGRIYGVFRKK